MPKCHIDPVICLEYIDEKQYNTRSEMHIFSRFLLPQSEIMERSEVKRSAASILAISVTYSFG